jgi:hypothetical protein
MFRSHLSGDEAGTPTLVNQVSDGVIRSISQSVQTLPTNGTQPLATQGNTPIPTSPASPLSYSSIQPLAVMASRVLIPDPVAVPAKPPMSTATKLGIGAIVLVGLSILMKARK